MSTTPTVTYQLDPGTYEVLTDALEQHAAHLEQQTHEPLFAPTTEDRTQLLLGVLQADELRRAIEDAEHAGTVTLTLDPTTFGLLSAALASYHADQQHAVEEATQVHDDPEDGDLARRAAATADRLHVQAVEAAQFTSHN